jgi:hypothetical protein
MNECQRGSASMRIEIIIGHELYENGAIQCLIVRLFYKFRRHDIDQVFNEIVRYVVGA